MGEFELISRFFEPLGRRVQHPEVALGIGDDCALLQLPAGEAMAISVDSLIEGVHFPEDCDPERLGWRSLAVAASDLAAMGARPLGFTLAVTLPQADPSWLAGFARGLGQAAQCFDLALFGGNTTRGPLNITIQVQGSVPPQDALRRRGARTGDLICVSGTLGDAGEALNWLEHPDAGADVAFLLDRYYRPTPRLALGQALRRRASAAIDISDGFLADLGHILTASGVGAVIDADALPISPALHRVAGEQALQKALQAGDDYELCFCWPSSSPLPAKIADTPVTAVGVVEAPPGIRLRSGSSVTEQLSSGFDHFRPPTNPVRKESP